MGLFGKKKNEVHHEKEDKTDVGSFAGFALLSDVKWDKDKFVADFKEDWGIEISEDAQPENPDDGNKLLYTDVEGMRVVVGLIEGPVPDGEAEYWAEGNFMWKEAVDVVKTHKAQLIVAVLGGNDDLLAKGKVFVKLAATAMLQQNAIAFYSEGAVYSPNMYRDFAEPLKDDELPLLNLVWIGIFGNENEIGCYTYGMRRFGKEEMEVYVPRQNADLNNIRGFLLSICDYVLEGDVVLKDGETIGFSEEQKLPITLSKGVAVDGNSLKIVYGEE